MTLNRRNIAALSTLVAITAAVALAARSHGFRAPAAPPDYAAAHAAPFDVADEGSRAAYDTFVHRTVVNYGLQPRGCDSGDEYYRAERTPGFGPGEFAAVELRISGNLARGIRRELGRESPDTEIDWHIVSNELVDTQTVQLVRDDAMRLLRVGSSAAGMFGPVDSSEWVVDMCWHGRYHFFRRMAPEYLEERGNPELVTFANRLLDLGKTGRPVASTPNGEAKNCPQ